MQTIKLKERLKLLEQLVEKYNVSYYQNNISEISDEEYDNLLIEIKSLKNQLGINTHGPSDQVGGKVEQQFEKVVHVHPMLSLSNVFSIEEFIEFDTRIKKIIGTDYTYVCELKIDGLAMSIKYENEMKLATTRGDGKVGENVTHNVKPITTLPKYIKHPKLEVRGEVFLSKQEFKNICNLEQKQYANARNLVAGSIRQINVNDPQKRNLDMFIYGLINPELYGCETYYESMNFLKNEGFKINEKIKLCTDTNEVIAYIKEITKIRNELEYDIDGIVIKINEYKYHKELGNTVKYPKWATAYKFKSDEAITKINDIFLTVGRTGKITPNADLLAVSLMGSTITRATLHNAAYIKAKDIRIGDNAIIIKAGDVIPRVEKIDFTNRINQVEYEFPKHCPVCSSVLEIIDLEHYCLNELCTGRKLEGFVHFVSRNAMNIDGFGRKIIERLIEHNLLKTYRDIYYLTYEQLIELDNFQEKSVNNLLLNIKKSLDVQLENFLYALGIKFIGLVTAKLIIQNINEFEDLFTITVGELIEIDGVGLVSANSLVTYFEDEENILMIQDIISCGINPIVKHKIINKNKYSDKKICITGTFDKYRRNDIKLKFESYGSKIVTQVSKNTDFLVVGQKPGSKINKASEHGITLIKENELDVLMGEEI